MRIVIVEDEVLIAERIKRMTEEILGSKVSRIAIETTLEDASHHLFKNPVDLLILDLNLNGKNGFELLKTAVSGAFHTIIVSANTDRALEAFEYGVLDFVGKPFTKERLKKAYDRYENKEKRSSYAARYLSVRKQERLFLVDIDDIHYIKGAGIYSEIHLHDGRNELHDKTLSRLETILPSHFIRTHKSYIVNLRSIDHFRSLGASTYKAVMKSGQILPVSRVKYKEIKHLVPRTANHHRPFPPYSSIS